MKQNFDNFIKKIPDKIHSQTKSFISENIAIFKPEKFVTGQSMCMEDYHFIVLHSNPPKAIINDSIYSFKMQRLNVGFSRAKDTMVFVHSMPIEDYSDTRLGDALKHYRNILDSTVDNYIKDEEIFDSEAEKGLYRMLINTEFYKNNRDSIKIIAQFPIGKYIKETYKRYIPNYRVDFLITLSKSGKEQSLILEYDGVEYHTKNPEIVTEHNFSQEYLDYDIERQIELESYGYRFLRINKFTLIPKEKGQTKIDVLNMLLEKKFQ